MRKTNLVKSMQGMRRGFGSRYRLAVAGLALLLHSFGPARPVRAQTSMEGTPVAASRVFGPVTINFQDLASAQTAAA